MYKKKLKRGLCCNNHLNSPACVEAPSEISSARMMPAGGVLVVGRSAVHGDTCSCVNERVVDYSGHLSLREKFVQELY